MDLKEIGKEFMEGFKWKKMEVEVLQFYYNLKNRDKIIHIQVVLIGLNSSMQAPDIPQFLVNNI